MSLKFKGKGHAVAPEIKDMQPALVIVLGVVLQFCKGHMLECKVTNIKHKFPQSESNTHPEGRAFDVSVKGWKEEDIHGCMKYVRRKVGNLGAISNKSNDHTIAVFHNVGLGPHLHFQVAREVYF